MFNMKCTFELSLLKLLISNWLSVIVEVRLLGDAGELIPEWGLWDICWLWSSLAQSISACLRPLPITVSNVLKRDNVFVEVESFTAVSRLTKKSIYDKSFVKESLTNTMTFFYRLSVSIKIPLTLSINLKTSLYLEACSGSTI